MRMIHIAKSRSTKFILKKCSSQNVCSFIIKILDTKTSIKAFSLVRCKSL